MVPLFAIERGPLAALVRKKHRTMSESGADKADTFNPSTNSYTTATGTVTLGVGQGAWVFSSTGGALTLTST